MLKQEIQSKDRDSATQSIIRSTITIWNLTTPELCGREERTIATRLLCFFRRGEDTLRKP